MSEEIQRVIHQAHRLRGEERFDEAINLLYAALGDHFGHESIIGALATLLAETEQFERAERLFERLLEQPLPSRGLLLNYATFLAHSGRLDEARPVFNRAMAATAGVIQRASNHGDTVHLPDCINALALAECNLARLHLAQDDAVGARALAEKWMVLEDSWVQASDIVTAAIELEGGDVEQAMRQFHLESRAAPDMVASLVDSAYTTGKPQQRYEVLAIMAMSAHYLAFDWLDEFDGFRNLVDDAVRPLTREPESLPDDLRPLLVIVGRLLGEDWTDMVGEESDEAPEETDQLGFEFT